MFGIYFFGGLHAYNWNNFMIPELVVVVVVVATGTAALPNFAVLSETDAEPGHNQAATSQKCFPAA